MKGWNREHAYAHCTQCEWDYTDFDKDKVKGDLGAKCKKHAAETGHRVYAEIGFSKDY